METQSQLGSLARGGRGHRIPALVGIVGLALLGVVLVLWLRSGGTTEGRDGPTAPAFTLEATDGSRVSLADHRGERILLYFSEGVGCDACFFQMASLEQDMALLRDADIDDVLPIVVNPVGDVVPEIERFDLRTPWLIDADRSVSAGYGLLGAGMHADLPAHGFVLVDERGAIVWTRTYPSMHASAQQLVADMHAAGA